MKAYLMSHGLTEPQSFFWAYIVPLTLIALALIWFGAGSVNLKGATTTRSKVLRVGGLLLLWICLAFAWFWLINWLLPEPEAKDMITFDFQSFDWMKWLWRLGLSAVVAVLWHLSFQRLLSGKHLVDLLYTKEKPEKLDTSYQLISMVAILIGILMCILLPSFAWLGITVLIIGVVVHALLTVPVRERWVLALFGDAVKRRVDLVTRERSGGRDSLVYFDAGLNWSFWLVLLPFVSYMRFLHTKSPWSGKTPEFTTAESTSPDVPGSTDDDINITGTTVELVWLLEGLELNRDPSFFLNASEEVRKNILGAVTNVVNSFLQRACKDLNYKQVLAWETPKEEEAQELAERLLKETGSGFDRLRVTDVNAPEMEQASKDLATSRAVKQKEKFEAVADAARDKIVAEGDSVAYKTRVDGALKTMGFDPETATPDQRAQAIALMNSVTIAENQHYLVPPGGAASGINLLVQAPTAAPRQR